MSIVVLAIIFAVLGIGLGLIYNLLVIKHYPENKRKSGYVVSVIIFLLFTLIFFGIATGNSIAKKAVEESFTKLEQDIKDKYPNNALVRNGIDLKGMSTNNVISDLRSLLPTAQQLEVPKIVYDLSVDEVMKILRTRLAAIEHSTTKINQFADENGILTISSISNGLQKSVIKTVNIASLVIALLFMIPFIIYIVRSLTTASKEKKSKET